MPSSSGRPKSPGGKPVPIALVQDAIDRVEAAGEIEISVDSVRYRIAFIGAVLRELPDAHVVESASPPRIRLRCVEAMTEHGRASDLRFATNEERRYALAYLRWLAGGADRRTTMPSASHAAYSLDAARGEQIRQDIEMLVVDAAEHLRRGQDVGGS